MTFITLEELIKNLASHNKYQAVMMAAREARRINKIPKENRGEDGIGKVTTLALRKLLEGRLTLLPDREKDERR